MFSFLVNFTKLIGRNAYVLPLGFTFEKAISRLLELQFFPNIPASVHHLVISLHVASLFSAFVAHLENDPFRFPPDAMILCVL